MLLDLFHMELKVKVHQTDFVFAVKLCCKNAYTKFKIFIINC